MRDSDLTQLKNHGVTPDMVEKQIEQFKKGFPFANILRPAVIDDGITSFSEEREENLVQFYKQSLKRGVRPAKFVPASGAATRMFKDLFAFTAVGRENSRELAKKEPYSTLFAELEKFPFYSQLEKVKGLDIDNQYDVISAILNDHGLGYGSKPKGVLSFHNYESGVRTASMEHLFEGADYAIDKDGVVNLHFTVSPEHLSLFKDSVQELAANMERELEIKFNITYSFQKPSTDTIAVDTDNRPFRGVDGNLVFRPAGHGALIENLNDMDADVIFIKNIDNVASQDLLDWTTYYKMILAGYALELQGKTFDIIRRIELYENSAIDEGLNFVVSMMNKALPSGFESLSQTEKQQWIVQQLNRPIRVCGMVKNEGEPGGGPFWVQGSDGATLQIVESAQVDLKDAAKAKIFNQSTHFNPVDLICLTKNHKGEKFSLPDFVDRDAGFISEKSVEGKPIRALELPGLWNGAMADWLTFFVEVPPQTFNPVKTVMDLLRPAHQPSDEF